VLVSVLNSSDADRVGYFPHSQGVCDLFRCSIHLMLTVSDTCFDHRVYVLVSILDSSHTDRVSHIAGPQGVRACFYAQFI
jgi:hypothetical protein